MRSRGSALVDDVTPRRRHVTTGEGLLVLQNIDKAYSDNQINCPDIFIYYYYYSKYLSRL